jgi:hypothetical protein
VPRHQFAEGGFRAFSHACVQQLFVVHHCLST